MPNEQLNHVFIQQSTLEKLKCFSCKKYLSILPIKDTRAGNAICGRCPTSQGNSERNILYEYSIEYQKFPCAYRDSGCLETDIPSKIAKHEKKCQYKTYKCPKRLCGNCTWEGGLADILDHFEQKHSFFILKEHKFQLSYGNSSKENYLMPYDGEMYVVTTENNSTTISVYPLDTIGQTELGFYKLCFESKNEILRDMQEKLGQKINFNSNFPYGILTSRSVILVRITIDKDANRVNQRNNAEESKEDTLGHRTINYDDLRVVECPVCLHYMSTPIYQCAIGHNICEECMATQESCPTCRGAFIRTRNFGLETLMMSRTYPCRYDGCKFTAPGAHIKQHEADCRYAPINCPLKDCYKCDDTFSGVKLFDHIQQAHHGSLLQCDTIDVLFREGVTEDIVETYITWRYETLFKICFRHDVEHEEFLWEVQIIGTDEQRSKYYFELEIIDNTGNDMRLYVKGNCATLSGSDETFANDRYYVMFSRKQLARFITDKLTYRILIKEKI